MSLRSTNAAWEGLDRHWRTAGDSGEDEAVVPQNFIDGTAHSSVIVLVESYTYFRYCDTARVY